MYEKRWIATAVSFFVIGIALGIYLNDKNTVLICTICAIAAVIAVSTFAFFSKFHGATSSKRITAAAFAVAALSLGVLRVCLSDSIYSKFEAYDEADDIADIQIIEINDTCIDGKILNSGIGVPNNTKVRIYTSADEYEMSVGDTALCELKYNFSKLNSLKSNSINLIAIANIKETTSGSGILYEIRNNVYENSKDLFGDFKNAEGISKGITIGDRSDISSYVFTAYRDSGISHILAISGLHVSVIIMSLYNVLRALGVNRKAVNIITICFSLLFAALTGFSVGTLRSVIMITIVMMFGLFFRKADSFTALFIALLMFVIANPYAICSIGMQLSFLCTLGILLIIPLTEKVQLYFSLKIAKSKFIMGRMYKLILSLTTILLTSFVASVFSYPVVFYNFSTTSTIAPILNIVAIPVFTVAMVLALFAYLLAPLSICVAMIFSYPSGFLLDFITDVSMSVHEYNIGVVSTKTSIMVIPLFIALSGVVAIIWINRNKNLVAITSFLVFGLSVFVCGLLNESLYNDLNRVEYGCNYGEYIFCVDKGNTVYVDLGGNGVDPEAVYRTGNVRLENYIALEYNASTYQHIDHITSEIVVENLILPKPKNKDDAVWLDKIKVLANERTCDIINFDNCCSLKLSERTEADICGENNLSKPTSIYIKSDLLRIQYLGVGFDNKAKCNIAIVSKECKTDIKDINAQQIYIPADYSKNVESRETKTYKNGLIIEIVNEEGGYRIYEP